MKTKRIISTDYGIRLAPVVAPVIGGKLLLICSSAEELRPWVRLLTAAGLALEKQEQGQYLFIFDGLTALEQGRAPCS